MRYIFASLLIGLSLGTLNSCNTDRQVADLEVTITHQNQLNKAFLQVDLNFEADPGGITHLTYQDKAWGQDSLFNAIKEIEILDEGKIEVVRDSNRIIIEHDPNIKRLNLRYRLVQDYEGPTTSRKVYRPIIRPEFFQVFGQNLFILPERLSETDAFDIHIDWKVPNSNFYLQNSFANHEKDQIIEKVNQEELYVSVFTGGDFRIYDMDIQGNQVAFAIRDQWEVFEDSTMINLLKSTISAQRNFWNDHSQPYFSVTMIPIYEQYGSSWQGTGLTHSFALAASNNERLEVNGLARLLNHELQHNWIGLTIKNENEEEQYWFSEGFTDYYAIKNIASEQIHGLDGSYFIEEFNTKLRELYNSPVVAAPNSEIRYDNFWRDRNYSNLPYERGMVFAFILDQRIKRDSQGKKSLDDVMKQFYEQSDTKLSHGYFLETVNPYLNESIDTFFEQHIIDGVPFDMIAILEESGLEYLPTATVFQLGVKKEEDDERGIAQVNPDSNAFKAGLRAGDRIISQRVVYDDPAEEASFVVKRGDKEMDIKFFPAREVEIPQLKTTEQNLSLLGF